MRLTSLTTFYSGEEGMWRQGETYGVTETRAAELLKRKLVVRVTEPAPAALKEEPQAQKRERKPRKPTTEIK